MQRAGRTWVVATTIAVAAGLAVAAPASAAPEPVIDATGTSSGVAPTAPVTTAPVTTARAEERTAPTTNEPVLTTQVPLPVDPQPPVSEDDERPADTPGTSEPVLSTQVPLPPDPLADDPEPELATGGDGATDTDSAPDTTDTTTTTTTTTVPGVVINGPARVNDTPAPTAPPALNEVGGTVFVDVNRNGIDDGAGSDPRAPGIGVFVIWDGADGRPGTADDRKYETATGTDGAFRVGGLPDGGYTIALNPAMLPPSSTVTVDPDGGLADATSVITLVGGTVNHGQHFGLGTRPVDHGDAGVIVDFIDGGEAPQSDLGGSGVQPIVAPDAGVAPAPVGAVDPAAQVLPATGPDEVAWAVTLATIFLLAGVALLGVRRRDESLV